MKKSRAHQVMFILLPLALTVSLVGCGRQPHSACSDESCQNECRTAQFDDGECQNELCTCSGGLLPDGGGHDDSGTRNDFDVDVFESEDGAVEDGDEEQIDEGDGGGIVGDSDEYGDSGSDGESGFPVASFSTTSDSYDFVLSVTDVTGPIACALSLSYDSIPGSAASQTFARFTHDTYGSDCPNGTYAIGAEMPCDEMPRDQVWPGCARYREWNDSGEEVSNVVALGGAVIVSGRDICRYEMSLVFPDRGTFNHTFEVEREESFPWCDEGWCAGRGEACEDPSRGRWPVWR